MKPADIRREYIYQELHRSTMAADPYAQFVLWLDNAVAEANIPDPTAAVLATVNSAGQPSQRTVLLKDFDARGFTFFTNLHSHKSDDMHHNAQVSLLFQWLPHSRQVIINGSVQRTSRTEDENYFATRPRASQLAAWASQQSSVLDNRASLEAAYADMEQRFAEQEVPCPPHWGGWRICPVRFEFWQGRPCRLHDRLVYSLQENIHWQLTRLAP
jgi:pyridoxamine 5'-phosphate oxidase